MAHTSTTALSLFSGVGGLDIGWELVTGGRVVGYAERDAYAASVLLARMEDAALEPAPVWCGDIAELDVAPFRGVEWVLGGFPCQDISVAGKREGIDGARSSLWRELWRAYRDSGARYLFAENVSALTVRGLDRVLCDLAEIGADVWWTCVRASDIGAPHRRERCFILAERIPDAIGSPVRNESRWWGRPDGEGAAGAGHDGKNLAARNQHGCKSIAEPGLRRAAVHDADGCGEELGDACQSRLERNSNSWVPGSFPPGPSGDWTHILDHLQPAIKSGFRFMVDGTSLVVDASRADQLRCLGNGVVPLQSAAALVELLERQP